MKLLFLSDVHLGALTEAENSTLEEEIIQIINFCESNNYTIHILGDLLTIGWNSQIIFRHLEKNY